MRTMPFEPDTLEQLARWSGRSEEQHDVVTPQPMRALAATLDRAAPHDGVLPPLWHWLYFLPVHAQSELGDDGHARRGGFLPPVPLPRRMWAGGRLTWHAPLRAGDAIVRRSTIASVTHKAGRSGDLVFVVVHHDIEAAGRVALHEEHDIVYRDAPRPGDAAPAPTAAPADAAWRRRIVPDPVLLFRYSALTFNGHRIHYDHPYVTQVEGYPGLIVHGPLIATLLMDLVQRERPDAAVRAFSFRAVKPLFDTAPFEVCGQAADDGRTAELWARDAEGHLCMQAVAELT
ncbi:MAG: MaoC family dehydratase N-terminal domain-containing protein [Proteobacteria bacterium]|nr:MaoC family dehydratase N-terminal domain-containing protein [Pseudomonadota bacterium]